MNSISLRTAEMDVTVGEDLDVILTVITKFFSINLQDEFPLISESAIIDSGTSLIILYEDDLDSLVSLFNLFGDCQYMDDPGMI